MRKLCGHKEVACQVITAPSAIYDQAMGLLGSFDLDTSDIEANDVRLWSIEDQGQLIGVVGLERSLGIGLLRSLAVANNHRGKGFARELCQAVFEQAKVEGISELYLLTETAASFFEKLGFSEIERHQAPDSLRATSQFSLLCPDSAAVMVKLRL